MKNQFTTLLDNLLVLLIIIIAALTPLLVFNQMTEFYEMPKLVFLIVGTLIVYVLWTFSWIFHRKISITRTPLDIPLVLLLVGVVVSTFFSDSRITSIYGSFPRVHGSAAAWITYILLYFVTVSNLKKFAQIKAFLYVLYGSAVIVSVISLLSFFGVFLPYDFAKAANFSLTGSTFSTIAYLLLLLPYPVLSIMKPNKYLPTPFAIPLAALFGITIVLLGSAASYFLLLIVFLLCFLVPKRRQLSKVLPLLLIPVALIVLTLIFSYLPIPGVNKIQTDKTNFPKEIQLPFVVSWKISASALRDAPFVGTGPSTYLYNFTSYKPIEFNRYDFWGFSFDSAYNEFLQTLGTLGLFGLLSLFFLCLVVLIHCWRNIFSHTLQEGEDESAHQVVIALSISGLMTILLLAIHATTLVSVVATLIILAILMASQPSIRDRATKLSMGIRASAAGSSFDLLPVIIFIAFLICAVYLLFNVSRVFLADYWHRQALAQASKSGTLTYQYLQRAESLNPYIDLYRVDMAQTNFALANSIVAQKGPSKSAPQGTLTNKDKATVQTLLSQAINEGKVSITLSPRSSRNWAVLALIYRNIAGVAQNALAFSLDAYGRAIQRDPLNPILRLNVGGIYYSAKNYNLATRFFTDAVNLKPDYPNAYYNLAIALRDNNDLQNALLVAQQAVSLLEKQNAKNTADYKTATALVAQIKDKIAAVQAQNAKQPALSSAPAAQTNSALGNTNISNINVNNLNNPPQTSPPPPVKPNPKANIPQPSKTPSVTPLKTLSSPTP